MNKHIDIIGGGTTTFIRNHLGLSAPAYGGTARRIAALCKEQGTKLDVITHLTRMADPTSRIETPQEVGHLIDQLLEDVNTKIIFMPVAMVDYDPYFVDGEATGKKLPRLSTSKQPILNIKLSAAAKLIRRIRKDRKDIFLVGFKTTTHHDENAQYLEGLNLLKGASCNLVLANDETFRRNMIITPEEARYHVTQDREEALSNLVEMTLLRSHLTFTQSTVVSGDLVPWYDDRVPASLRTVVDYLIKQGAYKPFRGATVGHFAVKIDDTTFLTSRRKTNFNDLKTLGLVLVKTDGPDSVLAYGAKPSVGGQSQRIVFSDHPGMDCIVHAHVPIKSVTNRIHDTNSDRGHEIDEIPIRSQREYECGSHQCGKNTSDGLKQFGNLKAVMLDQHGPNIVFNRNINPQEVIDFIDRNFNLQGKTGGPVQ